MRPFLSLLFLFFLAGCGYTLIHPQISPRAISTPFIEGDTGGELTRAIIRDLSKSAYFKPTICGRYTLEINMISSKDENVGFRYDTNSLGELLNTIIPSETRWSLLVDVSIIDTYKGCLAFGPARVSASHAFDHDWYKTLEGDNVFSLGQVTDFGDAKESVYPVIAKKLAQKIVDLLDQIGPGVF